ncbi:MAG TPA: uroporphyrinogen decarboxylase family protein, partial [Candidatus Glassbacteria bacterium]|nr:uroporphyrinogen decarboxylase family protein [Candidatus Glassbacteria bacterium]
MNGRERVLTAIAHREPDRVPITFDAQPEVYDLLYEHFGISTRAELWDALHVDTWLEGPVINDPREKPLASGLFQNRWGYHTKRQPYQAGEKTGYYDEIVYHPLAAAETVAEVEEYDWPDPALLEFQHLNELRRTQPEKAIIAHITHGGYFNATFLRGMEQFLVDLALNENLAQALVEHAASYLLTALDRLIEQAPDGFDIFYVADDYCMASGPLFSPDVFKHLIKPYLRRIADQVHGSGKKFLLHVCGSVRLLLPEIIDSGVDILEPVQRRATGMNLEALKREFGRDLTFYGSVDLLEILNKGTVAQVKKEVRRNLQILGPGGGFIIGPGHTYIQIDTP